MKKVIGFSLDGLIKIGAILNKIGNGVTPSVLQYVIDLKNIGKNYGNHKFLDTDFIFEEGE